MTFELDAEVAATLQAIAAASGPASPSPAVGDVAGRRLSLNAMLEQFNNVAQSIAADVEITEQTVPASDGQALRARWYRPATSDSSAAVLYLHGGGMILGSVPIFDGPVSRYVAATGVPMLSLEYRLAPEHPHPTPVEDVYSGLVWLAKHAAQLGIDTERIAVMGDSAGGGLAAAVAIVARDRGGPVIAHQILIYPMLDDRNTVPDQHLVPFAAWSYDDNLTGWTALLGDRIGRSQVDPSAAPARVADATGLPPRTSRSANWTSFATRTLLTP